MTTGAKAGSKLAITLPSDREIAMTRVFDAPRRLVWEALTKPELVSRWLGVFEGHTMPVCEIDLRVGGKYRYVWLLPDGKEMGMGGVFREIAPHDRIVATEKFDDPWYEGEALSTTTLVEKDGRTTMTMLAEYDSKEIRDAVLKTPMDSGVSASFDVLEGILKSQR